jgi:hypothetical protein
MGYPSLRVNPCHLRVSRAVGARGPKMGRSRHGGLSALHSPNYAQFCKKANFERARYTFVDAKSPAPLSLSMTPNVKPSKASR